MYERAQVVCMRVIVSYAARVMRSSPSWWKCCECWTHQVSLSATWRHMSVEFLCSAYFYNFYKI